jgi:hypothetical protein
MLWTLLATLVLAGPSLAYVGPGAGLEFLGYAMSLLAMVGFAFFSLLMYPFYSLLRWLRGGKAPRTAAPPEAALPEAALPEAALPEAAPPTAAPLPGADAPSSLPSHP